MSFSETLIQRINILLQLKKPVIIAIDGRCASGKTTLANELCESLDAAVVHMDDFFLRPQQRTEKRLAEPGGNFDRERFTEEVLLPLTNGKAPVYRPYSCRKQALGDAVALPTKDIYIIEGSYSCHPLLKDFYDLRIFVTTDYKTQLRRIEKRNPNSLNDFINKWIPYEERYFEAFGVQEYCDLVNPT